MYMLITGIGNGVCIIEVFLRKTGRIDKMAPSTLKKRIGYLLTKCMGDGNTEGGIAVFLG